MNWQNLCLIVPLSHRRCHIDDNTTFEDLKSEIIAEMYIALIYSGSLFCEHHVVL